MQFADRLELIPPYLFAKINQRREELIAQGVDIINLGVGDPDQPTPAHILAAMQEAIADPRNHKYPPYLGMAEFRQAIANWMTRRFQITDLDPNQEILVSIGSKEAIHNTFLAFVNPGDYTLIPDPGYPVYRTATIFAGGQSYPMPLLPANNFLPVLSDIPEDIARQAKLLWVNYPNNPTGAIAHLDFWQELVNFCRKYDILLCHDHAYSEMAYDGYKPPSVLQISGAKDITIEFHSLSKSYNMTGWRIGFVVGNAQAIKGLGQVKTNVDSGVFKAIQRAGMAAFATSPEQLQSLMNVYQKRRDVIIQGLQSLGWPIKPPQGSLYIWVPVPIGYSSVDFVNLLIDKCGIIVPPGNGYGTYGEGFFRIALTIPEAQMLEAIDRMKKANITYQ